jgi:hypothetical protein
VRLFAAFLCLLLLLPSGLGAAWLKAVDCASLRAQAEAGCCCRHEAAEGERPGPRWVPDCCCEIEAPMRPDHRPTPAREMPTGLELPLPAAALAAELPPLPVASLPSAAPAAVGPRAPPLPLLRKTCRLLI